LGFLQGQGCYFVLEIFGTTARGFAIVLANIDSEIQFPMLKVRAILTVGLDNARG